MTEEGKPFAPIRYKQIVEERYLISKHIHTSYSDLADITPIEREYLLEFIKRDLDTENEIAEKMKRQSGN